MLDSGAVGPGFKSQRRRCRVTVLGKLFTPSLTAGFMIHVTCRPTAKNRDQLRNPMLGNRVWATFLLSVKFRDAGVELVNEYAPYLSSSSSSWNIGRQAFSISVCRWQISLHPSHARTVVRECCKGDDESQWERGKFDPPPPKNPLTDGHQNLCR